jgi:hypothetical protein
MMIFPLLWLPVVADFARFGRDQRAAGGGTFAGVFLASVWFGTLGILYLPATSSGDIPGFLVGMQLGLGALALLFVLQIDEVFVNAGAAGPAADALGAAGARYAPAVLLVAALPAAALLNVAELEWYVLLAASAFVPAFAIVCGRALWPAARHWTVPAIAWAAGFVLYQWISPAEIGWWQDACSAPFEALGLAFPLSEEVTWLGAAVPAFLLALCLDTLVPAALRLFSGRLSARPAVS